MTALVAFEASYLQYSLLFSYSSHHLLFFFKRFSQSEVVLLMYLLIPLLLTIT